MHTFDLSALSRLTPATRHGWIRLRQTCMGLIAALLLTATATAQTIDITATIGPELTWGPGTPIEYSWQQLNVSGLIAEEGFPVARLDRESGEPIAYPFEVSGTSGNSWAAATLATPGSPLELQMHLENDGWTIPATGSFEFHLQGWIADILIPAYSSGTILLDARINGTETPAYSVSGTLVTSAGTRTQTIPGTFTAIGMYSATDFNNAVNASPLHTGPVYFEASVRIDALPPPPPIPEPSRAWMLVAGIICLGGYTFTRRRTRTSGRRKLTAMTAPASSG